MLARFRNDEKMEMNQTVMVGKAVFRVRQDFFGQSKARLVCFSIVDKVNQDFSVA